MVREEVPVELRRLWGHSVASRLGRPAELDVRRVVLAAVELADRDGLSRVSLPRIAGELGCTTMALYRHVGSKDELLTLMQDFAIGEPPKIVVPEGDWREGLRQWALAELRLNARRPWLARLPIAPPAGPNQIAWMESALRILRGTALGWAEKVRILMVVSGYVRQATLQSQDLARVWDGIGIDKAEGEERYGRNLANLIEPSRFPEAASLFNSGVFDAGPDRAPGDCTADPDFVFGLEIILDGVAAAVLRKRRSRQLPRPTHKGLGRKSRR